MYNTFNYTAAVTLRFSELFLGTHTLNLQHRCVENIEMIRCVINYLIDIVVNLPVKCTL